MVKGSFKKGDDIMFKSVIFYFFCFVSVFSVINVSAVEERCQCYSARAAENYRLPFNSSSWPPHKIESTKNFFIKSIEDLKSKITIKIDYLDYTSDYDEYCNLYSRYSKQKQIILNKCGDFSANSGASYPSRLESLYGCEYELAKLHYDWSIAHENFLLNHKKCGQSSTISGCRSLDPEIYQKHIDEINKNRAAAEKLRLEKRREADQQFQNIATFCMHKHVTLRTYFEHALHQINQGDYVSVMQTTKKLIDYASEASKAEYLKAETYVQLGVACSMSFEFGQAIEALTEALIIDPTNSEAYLERAIAYFELGNFELAIRDFLASGNSVKKVLPLDPYNLEFAIGLAKGGHAGLIDGTLEMPASLMNTIYGLGRLLWAGATHPIDTYGELSESVHEIIIYLRTEEALNIAIDMVPELRQLLEQWDSLDSNARGEQAGYILGKYGLEVIIPGTAIKAIKKYQNLRRANALCTLESMSISVENKVVLEKLAQEAAVQRVQFFKTAKLNPDKQGKHLVGHRNYDPKLGDKFQPSILRHPDPEKLLKEHAGKGSPKVVFEHGQGYKEVVDFREYIGDFFDEKTNQFLSTTRGTIHYDKTGSAHIVPASPNTL